MRTNIRPSVPADAPAIVELLAAAGLKPNVEPERTAVTRHRKTPEHLLN
jgi:hypothetical protein